MTVAAPDSPFVFIGGLHRSGTGLFRDLIAGHPSVGTLRNTGAMEDEGHHFQTALPAHPRVGRPGKMAYRRDAHLDGADAARFAGAAQTLCSDWAPYWQGGAKLFLEKSPITLLRALLFAEMFPRSRFVMVMRHPVAVSYATQKWTVRPRLPIAMLMRHWLHAHDVAARDATQLDDRVIFVRYEQLLADPGATMRRLQRFCGLDPVPVDVSGLRSSGNDVYLRRWSDAAAANPVMHRAMIGAFGSRCREFGYDVAV